MTELNVITAHLISAVLQDSIEKLQLLGTYFYYYYRV